MRTWATLGSATMLTVLLMMPAQACPLPPGWLEMTGTEKPPVQAAMTLDGGDIIVGQPFTVDLAVCAAAGSKIERITIDATMPRHRHGMNYKPRVSKLGNGRYRAQSFVFHMPGLWRVVVTTYQQGQPIYLQRDFQVQ